MPDALRILIYLPHAMKRHPMNLTLAVSDLKRLRIVRRKGHSLERNCNDPVLRPIVVTQFKTSLPKLSVPTDAVEQFVNRNHATGSLWPLETVITRRICDWNRDT